MPNIVTIDGLPVYQALVEDEKDGMLRISLVDDPAVKSDFVAFAKEPRRLLYAVQDEEKRLVLGVVMRADFPIFRRDAQLGEYYIVYKADTIRKMAEKYLAENRQNLVNLMHEDGSEVDGVQMVQYFIKGAGLAPEGFEEIADGSLFAEFHVTNDEVWDAIKAGTYKGFSLEGLFQLAPERNKGYVEEIVDILDGQFSNQAHKDMTKRKGLLARLARAIAVEMQNITTDKGILHWDTDEDLKAGDNVQIEDGEGNLSTAPDGIYTTVDGKAVTVVDGKVAAITDGSAEVAPAEPEGKDPNPAVSKKNTDKGEIEWDGNEDLKEGDAVYTRDAEGNRVPAEDGDYITDDGKTITVTDGKVASITDPAAEVSDEEQRMRRLQALSETYDDKLRRIYAAIAALGYDPYGYIIEAGDEFAIYEAWGEDGEHFYRFKVLEWDEEGNPVLENGVEVFPTFVTAEEKEEIEASFAAEVTAKEAAQARVVELEAQIAAKPAGKPAHEDVSAATVDTGNKGLDRLAKLAGSK